MTHPTLPCKRSYRDIAFTDRFTSVADAYNKKRIAIVYGAAVDSAQMDAQWCEDDLIARNQKIIKQSVPQSLIIQQIAARKQATAIVAEMGNQ